jgi:DNA-binding MarR family transcriptional regulator
MARPLLPVEPLPRVDPPDIEALTRELGRTSAMIDATMAAALGLSITDFACWTIVLSEQRPMPAGRLAMLAELSTGAVTGVLDRLERRGLVRRMPDAYDRRKVLVGADPHQRQRMAQVWDPVRQLLAGVLSRRTEPERAVIARYLDDVVHAIPTLLGVSAAPTPRVRRFR